MRAIIRASLMGQGQPVEPGADLGLLIVAHAMNDRAPPEQ